MTDLRFVEFSKAERAEYVGLLDRLENGGERLAVRGPGAKEFRDTTAEEIEKSRRIIANLDAVIAEHSEAE